MITLRTQKEAADAVGVSRWTVRKWENQHPQLRTAAGGYDYNLLMLLASPDNPSLVKNIQAECHSLLSKINDPEPLLLIEAQLNYFANNPSLNMQRVQTGLNQQQIKGHDDQPSH